MSKRMVPDLIRRDAQMTARWERSRQDREERVRKRLDARRLNRKRNATRNAATTY
jgi:hypothetical protein